MKPLEYEFSPDLSWMLISGQVSDEVLLEALYEEFSPDSNRLAVFGYPGQYVEGSLIVVDLANSEANGRNTLILDHLGEASNLIWSPDGEQIAIIACCQSSAFLEEIFIYDLSTGEIGDLTQCAAAPQAGP